MSSTGLYLGSTDPRSGGWGVLACLFSRHSFRQIRQWGGWLSFARQNFAPVNLITCVITDGKHWETGHSQSCKRNLCRPSNLGLKFYLSRWAAGLTRATIWGTKRVMPCLLLLPRGHISDLSSEESCSFYNTFVHNRSNCVSVSLICGIRDVELRGYMRYIASTHLITLDSLITCESVLLISLHPAVELVHENPLIV